MFKKKVLKAVEKVKPVISVEAEVAIKDIKDEKAKWYEAAKKAKAERDARKALIPGVVNGVAVPIPGETMGHSTGAFDAALELDDDSEGEDEE